MSRRGNPWRRFAFLDRRMGDGSCWPWRCSLLLPWMDAARCCCCCLALWLLLTRTGQPVLVGHAGGHRDDPAAPRFIVCRGRGNRGCGGRAGGAAGHGRGLCSDAAARRARDDTAIVLRAGAQTELNSVVGHDTAALVSQAPQVLHDGAAGSRSPRRSWWSSRRCRRAATAWTPTSRSAASVSMPGSCGRTSRSSPAASSRRACAS